MRTIGGVLAGSAIVAAIDDDNTNLLQVNLKGESGCICPLNVDPVCAGGKTYSNSCQAGCDGVGEGEWTAGPCEEQFNCFTRDTRELWTQKKKDWCCKNKNLGCEKEEHNCLTKEKWSVEKQAWCCKHKQLGCVNTCKKKGEVFKACGSACPSTCKSLNEEPKPCTLQCVQDCFCDDTKGLVRDAKGNCVEEKECYNCLTRETWSDAKKDWCCKNQQLGCTKTCPSGEVYKPCGTNCPLTCEPFFGETKACNKMCKADCFCPEGTMRKNGSCIVEKKCREDKFNCDSTDVDNWTIEKKNWCCKKKKKGCCPRGKEHNCLAQPTTCSGLPKAGISLGEKCTTGCFCKHGKFETADGKCKKKESRKCSKEACPNGLRETFLSCGSACEPKCAKGPAFCTEQCILNQCQCSNGKVRRSDGKCVNPSNPKCVEEREASVGSKR